MGWSEEKRKLMRSKYIAATKNIRDKWPLTRIDARIKQLEKEALAHDKNRNSKKKIKARFDRIDNAKKPVKRALDYYVMWGLITTSVVYALIFAY